jgi:transcriptional regulator of aromatic amino acid metabolism
MAAADPTLIDDQWNLLFETLLDRLKAETATAKDIFARACESMSGRCRSRLKAV